MFVFFEVDRWEKNESLFTSSGDCFEAISRSFGELFVTVHCRVERSINDNGTISLERETFISISLSGARKMDSIRLTRSAARKFLTRSISDREPIRVSQSLARVRKIEA